MKTLSKFAAKNAAEGKPSMYKPTRRETLALGAGALIANLIGPRGAAQAAAKGETLTIAYNVNLPSFDPTVGPSAVNPTIQAIYRSIFDQYHRPEAESRLRAGPAHRLGLERRQDQDLDGRARRRDVARRLAVHAGRRGVVAGARRQPEDRQPGRLHLVDAGQLQDRRQARHRRRQAVHADHLQVDGVPHRLRACRRRTTPRSARTASRRSRSAPGPTWSTQYQGNAFLRLKANPNYWGGKPAFKTVVFKFVTDATSRVAEIESGSSDLTLEIPYEEYRPAQEEEGPRGRRHAGLRHRHDLHQLQRTAKVLTKDVRLAAHHAIDKQAIVEAAAARLRRADRHAARRRNTRPYDPTIKVPTIPRRRPS